MTAEPVVKIKIEASKLQIEALAGLIDAGLRATGLRAAKAAAEWSDILQAALDKYQQESKE